MLLQRICRQLDSRLWNGKNCEAHLAGVPEYATWARCSFRRSPGRLYAARQVLYSITKHAMRRSADEIGATSISFRPKVFSDRHRLLTEFFCELDATEDA